MRTQAIVIKKQHTGEYDQWITCYTQEYGKLTAVAKSVLKVSSLQSMQLDALRVVEFDLVSRHSFPIITAAQSQSPGVYNLKALAAGNFFLEILDKVVFDYQKDEHLWQFTVDFVKYLERPDVTLGWFRQQQRILLNILGYGLEVSGDENGYDYQFEQITKQRLSSPSFIYNVLK